MHILYRLVLSQFVGRHWLVVFRLRRTILKSTNGHRLEKEPPNVHECNGKRQTDLVETEDWSGDTRRDCRGVLQNLLVIWFNLLQLDVK